MNNPIKTIQVNGVIDEHHRLIVEEELPFVENSKVQVFILTADDSEMDEKEWEQAASTNPSFDFLNDPEENIYTLLDGKPFHA